MNPEDQFARLKRDDDRWENTRFGTGAPVASVNRRRLPLWGQLTIGIAAGLVVGLVVTLGVTNLRNDALPPAKTPSPTPVVPGAFLDDGYVMNRPFAKHFDATAVEPVVAIGANGSAPWAVIDAAPDDSSLTIAYVASGDFDVCGVHQGVDVTETDTTVTIALVTDAVGADIPCTELLRLGVGTVVLDTPLGNRALYHAPLTHPWDEATSPLLTVDPEAEVPEVEAGCIDFLYQQTQAALTDAGLSLRPDESYSNNKDGYSGEILDSVVEGAGEGTWASGNNIQYGGVQCRWEAGETYLDFGFGPITDDQSTFQQARLEAAGWEVDPDYPYPLLYGASGSELYAFGDGWWAHESNVSGLGSLLHEIIATSPHPDAFALGEEAPPASTPAILPPADPDVYLTTAGYGDLKLGAPVPSNTKLVQWFPNDCYGGRWGTPGSDPGTDPITVRNTVDSTNDKSNPIIWISTNSPDVRTKSGAHVGMSLAEITELFPDAEQSSQYQELLITVGDELGQVVFELIADEVVAINVIGADVEPYATQGGDVYGACYGG